MTQKRRAGFVPISFRELRLKRTDLGPELPCSLPAALHQSGSEEEEEEDAQSSTSTARLETTVIFRRALFGWWFDSLFLLVR